ncbi:MAG: serine/threonine protein kinase [Microbacteriaceae bacterium]|jgi:serine/threonine protein kinase|nr:serine/threonine protein kinase [Microbacteriaceae bacterium]
MRRATSSPPDLPGYTFIKILGSGGFSDVFLYEQKLPKRRVAVKVLLTEELTAANRAAFVAEANVMAQLSTHPYIVTIHQADVAADDRPYFVMEYCSGQSLAERYKSETFPIADALRTGVRLSSAIATAHAAGILHRDIKPANVLTNDYGWPALTDFGISSAVEEDVLPVFTGTLADALAAENTSTSGTGASVGMSVPWSPPEMFDDDPQPDPRSDIFSLAATIYTILAGQTPFEVRGHSNGTLDLIGRIERGAITPMSRDDLPASLNAVLRKGMATHRDDRFATAVDFARALQRIEIELGYTPTPIDVPNLQVDAPSRPSGPPDADETRARGVSTIAIQPPIFERSTPAEAAAVAVESTKLRSPVVVSNATPVEETVVRTKAPTTAEPTADVPVEAPAGRSLRGVLIGILIGVVVVIAIVVVIVIPKGTPSTQPTAAAGGGGGVVNVSTVPSPTKGVATNSADGTSVTFSWVNPKPKTGDTFLWSRAETPDQNTPTTTPQAVVSGIVPGSKVCINVSVLRDGTTSANPLVVCNQ